MKVGDIMITEEERKQLGLSPDSLKIQHPKTGEWGYRAGVEVFHQLHCLNLLRQAIYKDEYYGKKEIGGDVGDVSANQSGFPPFFALILLSQEPYSLSAPETIENILKRRH
jgi:hypothetical protein